MRELTCYPRDVVGQVKGFGAVKMSQEHFLIVPIGSRAGGRGRDPWLLKEPPPKGKIGVPLLGFCSRSRLNVC